MKVLKWEWKCMVRVGKVECKIFRKWKMKKLEWGGNGMIEMGKWGSWDCIEYERFELEKLNVGNWRNKRWRNCEVNEFDWLGFVKLK